jgi:hypothetical protein
MTLFSAAAAAALECSCDGHRPGIYAYPTELEFTAKTNGKYAPAIVVKILAKIVLDEPDVVFVAGNGSRIMVDTFPQSEPEFDKSGSKIESQSGKPKGGKATSGGVNRADTNCDKKVRFGGLTTYPSPLSL